MSATAQSNGKSTVTQSNVTLHESMENVLPAIIAAPPVQAVTADDTEHDTTSPLIEVTVRFTDTADGAARARKAFNAISRVQPPADNRPTSGAVLSFTATVKRGGVEVQETFDDVPFVVLGTDTSSASYELHAIKLRLTFVNPATSKPYSVDRVINARAFTSMTVIRRNPHYQYPAWRGTGAIGRDAVQDA